LYFSDSNAVYDYRPTAKQRINDGRWHQIVWVMDAAQSKARMYFDGINVAIYNVKGLGPLFTGASVVIGGTEEYGEYGSNYEWKSFNGMIDEVKIWDRPITGNEVSDLYERYRTGRIREQHPVNRLKVLAWNIWHGGRRTGEVVGVQRTIELIRSAKIDIVCMQETYGSGAIIADSLDFYFYLISSNLSIMSRYPIVEVYDIYKPFNSGSARIRLSEEQDIVVFCIWLHYLPNYTKHVREKSHTVDQLIEEEGKTRHAEIRKILAEAAPFLDQSEDVPVLMGGDFNSGSHLDWVERTRQLHNDYTIMWPVSTEMSEAGMVDSYRQSHPDPLLYPGITWTPRASTGNFADGSLDRIDYIYFKGSHLQVIRSQVMDYHPIQFPSDHAGVITTFELKQ
jgi:endonuclease/exonuclease/phosphatase family metal-dependent hydrolase